MNYLIISNEVEEIESNDKNCILESNVSKSGLKDVVDDSSDDSAMDTSEGIRKRKPPDDQDSAGLSHLGLTVLVRNWFQKGRILLVRVYILKRVFNFFSLLLLWPWFL